MGGRGRDVKEVGGGVVESERERKRQEKGQGERKRERKMERVRCRGRVNQREEIERGNR